MDPIAQSQYLPIFQILQPLIDKILQGKRQIGLQEKLGIPPIPPPYYSSALNQMQALNNPPPPDITPSADVLEKMVQQQMAKQLQQSLVPQPAKLREDLADLGPNVNEQDILNQIEQNLYQSSLPDYQKIKEVLDPYVEEAAKLVSSLNPNVISSGEDYQNSFLGALLGGLNPNAFWGSLLGNIGAGGLGLLGNIIQSQLQLGELQSGIAQTAPAVQEQFTKWLDFLKPYILSNRVGQFGEEARIGAQRAMNLPRLTPSDIAAAQALSQQAQQVGELGSLLGSRSIQEASRQIGAMKQAIRDAALGGDVAALSGAVRQMGQNIRSAMAEQALEKAMQGAQAAASIRAQIPQLLNQARQTTFATQIEPYLTQTNLTPLNTAAGLAGQVINTGQGTVLLPSNPFKVAGDLWAGANSATMGQNFINTNLRKGKVIGNEPLGRAAWFQKLFNG